LARREAAAAQAQFGVDRAELRPDPTVGLRVGQARSGGERFIGFALSLPFGGEHRGAVADVAAARAAVAAQRLIDAERRAQLDATLRLREAQATRALWRDQAEAAQRLDQVAQGLQRAYQLGEGSLNDLVAARRLAIEQQLSAAGSAVDAWMARQRLALESGMLWQETAERP
jgi:outer membrane protein TolC